MQKDLRIPLSKYKIIIALQIQNHFFQIFKYSFNFNVGPWLKATTKYALERSLKFESYLLYILIYSTIKCPLWISNVFVDL